MISVHEREEAIRRFLAGEMQPPEQERFRKLIEENPELRCALDRESGIEALAHECIGGAVSPVRYHRLLDEVVGSTRGERGRSGTPVWLRVYAIAATLVVAVLGGYLLHPRLATRDSRPLSSVDSPEPRERAATEEGSVSLPEDGKSITQLTPGGVLVAEEGTRARVLRGGDSTVNVVIARGNTCFDVARHGGAPVNVVTPHSSMTVRGTVFRVVVTELETEVTVLEGAVEVAHRSSPESPQRLAAGRTGFADHRALQFAAGLAPELCERRTALLRTYVGWVRQQMRG